MPVREGILVDEVRILNPGETPFRVGQVVPREEIEKANTYMAALSGIEGQVVSAGLTAFSRGATAVDKSMASAKSAKPPAPTARTDERDANRSSGSSATAITSV